MHVTYDPFRRQNRPHRSTFAPTNMTDPLSFTVRPNIFAVDRFRDVRASAFELVKNQCQYLTLTNIQNANFVCVLVHDADLRRRKCHKVIFA